MRLSKMIMTVAGTRIKTMDTHETLRKVIALDLDIPIQSNNSMFIKTATHKADRQDSKKELAFQLNDCEGRCRTAGRKHMAWYL